MMKRVCLCLAAVAFSSAFAQEPTQISSRINSIALFKNGLAVVSRTLDVDKQGLYVVEAPMRPIHGTFWIAPGQKVTVSGETRKLEEPNARPFSDLQASLLGHTVTLHLQSEGGKDSTVKGKVISVVPESSAKNWSRDYVQRSSSSCDSIVPPALPEPECYVAVQQENGNVSLVRSENVIRIESDSINQKIKVDRPVFIFDVKSKPNGPIYYSYLSTGIAWAPSYRMRLDDASKMTLSVSASIRNELEDFKDADIVLISGYPNVCAAKVTSLLCADTTWATFFQQGASVLNGKPFLSSRDFFANQNGTTDMVPAVSTIPDIANQPGESADIVLTPVGKMSLKEGGSTWFEIGSTSASYERIVECSLSECRDANGHAVANESGAVLWDAIRFKNPFKFPMSVVPVEITDASGFLGQCIGRWTNPNEVSVLRVTKALSVTARNTEHETDAQRVSIYVADNAYLKTTVQGVLTLKNFRSETAKIVAKVEFSGEFMSGEGNPSCSLLASGLSSVNKRNELTWELQLKPGEETNLKYTYSVLVWRR